MYGAGVRDGLVQRYRILLLLVPQIQYVMRNVADVLADPGLRDVRVLAGDPSSGQVAVVRLVEDIDRPGALPPKAFVILGTSASAAASGYRLDIALRRAAGQGVSAVLLTGPAAPERVAATAGALAQRSGVVLLSAQTEHDLADLVVAASAAIAGGAEEALRRADDALDRLRSAQSAAEPGDPAPLLAAASEALGVSVEVRDAEPGDEVAWVRLGGQDVSTVTAPMSDGWAAVANRLVVNATAAALERSLGLAERGEDVPTRSRSAVLSEILVAGGTHSARLAEQARRLGIAIDGWHLALVLEVVDASDPLSFDFLETLGRRALQAVRTPQRSWHLARSDDRVVLVEVWQHEPPSSVARRALDAGREVLHGCSVQFPQLGLRCGVGTVHQGLEGLRATVAEARAALASDGRDGIVGYDVVGLQPMLLEWYGSDTARQAIRELLTPLDALGGDRAETAISTLQAYLDEQGSLKRAAARLQVHRNAVAYRMHRISKLLDVDLDDADQRLALQLACRARLLR
jgi:sugar diacid utilization regulator